MWDRSSASFSCMRDFMAVDDDTAAADAAAADDAADAAAADDDADDATAAPRGDSILNTDKRND